MLSKATINSKLTPREPCERIIHQSKMKLYEQIEYVRERLRRLLMLHREGHSTV